ncbi:tetratricopeptide repeat-containing sensor histidine kinase [Flavisolibacter ginsenosidimutans]|uniref:Tetratricopeptide repeat protein n=1 Tax=Flavisolibacter ginsenosidimutans TaxID=661481 RepID=A0A5B8UMP0_9BACT|nr:tetratricopeptide repeat protein [Flavisolibacter ginsenosidimutans]QEC57947.1 tetratricopeptide repeat protein [Flavisolibacter ginsenosidimutans]
MTRQTKRLLFFCLLIGLGSVAFAQDTALLRLQRLPDDTAKANRLLAFARTYFGIDNKKAIEILEQGQKLSEQLHYDLGLAVAYKRIGYIHGQEGAYQDAINYYRLALNYYRNTKNVADVLAIYNNMGANLRQLGRVDSAIHYYMEGIERIEATDLEKESKSTKQDLLTTYALLNTNVSSLYGTMENVPKALAYGEKAIAAAKKLGDTSQLVLALVSVSHANEVKKDFASGLNYAREAVRLAKLQDEPIALSKSYHLLSICYTGLGNLDSAIYAAQRSMQLAKESDRQLYITSFLDLADAYHEKKEYRKEEALLMQGLKELQAVNNMAFYGRNLYEKLANTKYALGDYKAAFDFFEKSIAYKDSTLSEENRETVAKLETQYQTAEKEKVISENKLQLAQKDLQLQKNRNYMYYTLAALVVALLIAALLFIRARHKRRLHQKELKAIQQQKELQLLQALMQGEEKERSRIAKDLHDGVAGMLAAVKMHFSSMPMADELESTEGYRQGMKLLNEATQEVRKTSHNLMPEVLLQHGLDEALRRYCASVNNSRTLHIEYDSWGEVDRFDDGFELSVYRIVQELVNNIIKHSQATQAMVQLTQQKDLLSISIEDNGVGFSNDGGKEGMGLRSLQSRIKAMNGKLEVEASEQSGVSAYLEFDVAELKKEILTVHD